MTIYTVHLPPDAVEPHEVAERAVFVKEGFAVLGFIFTGLWLLAQRLWLHALVYFAVLGLLSALFWQFGLPPGAYGVISILLSILIGIEGNEAIRQRYARRGWTHAGTVSGPSLEECERRFFADWMANARTQRPAPPPPLPSARPSAGAPVGATGVLGVFPMPRGQTGPA